MRYKVVSIRDRAADVFGQPAFVSTIGVALRSFQDEVNNKESHLCKHAEDFDLYMLGEFDDNTGEFVQDGPPRQLAVGKDMLK